MAEIEDKLAEYVGVRHCITCGNGTDALTIALKAWGVGEGDAVFVPDFTFFASGECFGVQGSTGKGLAGEHTGLLGEDQCFALDSETDEGSRGLC